MCKTPLLSDVPVIGNLFKKVKKGEDLDRLLILSHQEYFNHAKNYIRRRLFELTGMAVSRGIISDIDFNKVITLNKESGKSVVSILFEQKLMDEYSLATSC